MNDPRSRDEEPFRDRVQDDPTGTGDEALAVRVRRALAEDASTTDLDLEVDEIDLEEPTR